MAVDLTVYERQRAAVDQKYTSDTAAQAYSRFLSQQRGDRAIADYRQDFSNKAAPRVAAWGHRGLTGGGVQSGAFQQALSNYGADFTRGLGRMYEDQAGDQNTYDLNQASLAAEQQRALAEIEAQKAQAIASTAANIEALRPYLGV